MKLTQSFLQHGYTQSKFDYSLSSKFMDGKQVYLLVYVDHLLIIGFDQDMIAYLKSIIQSHFKLKDLGSLKYFLGLEVARFETGIVVNKRKYAIELIVEAGLNEEIIALIPMK